jgi:uncharacterized protein YndB with AHSA1/START domain
LLDAQHAELWSHAERIGFLRRHGVEAGWWQQVLTVNYERARGLRLLGETKTAGFEFGISRTLAVAPERVWEALTTTPGVEYWAGEGVHFALEKGAYYEQHGVRVEVRAVTPDIRVRVWILKPGAPRRTVQMSVVPAAGGRCALRFHEEGLPGIAARKRAERHWLGVMDEIESLLSSLR